MTTLPGTQTVPRGAGPRRGGERSVGRRQWATVVAGCTEALARGHAHQKAWPGLGKQIGNTVCIPRQRRRSGAVYVDCYRRVVLCSDGSDCVETRHRMKNIPWCMGFIACFSHCPPLGPPLWEQTL